MGLIPFMHEFVFLVSTALLGSMAFTIGIDCYTTANLKEFFVYNLGFAAIFPKLGRRFSITSAMQIELGVILLVFFISVAAQIRLYNLFETKLAVILKKARKDEEMDKEEKAAGRITETMGKDIEKFEHRYSKGFPFAASPLDQSPSLGQHAFGTPRSETVPLLPELAYSTPSLPKSTHKEGINHMLSSYARVLVGGQDRERLLSNAPDSPRESSAVEGAVQPSEGLLQDILDKEKALEEITRLRERIGAERSSLRPSSASSANTSANSVAFPEPVYNTPVPSSPLPHMRSQSLTLEVANAPAQPIKRASAASVPRPISQYSLITTQASVAARPATAEAAALPMLQLDGPTRGDAATHHARHRSQGALMARSPSNNTLSGATKSGPQRIITGSIPSRPSSQSLQNIAIPRTQTMDIHELEARHRRKLSQIQSGSRNSLVLASAGSNSSKPPMRSPTMYSMPTAIGGTSRKRSSSAAGLTGMDGSKRYSQAQRQSMVDEFGQLRDGAAEVGSNRNSGRGSVAGMTLPSTLPTAQATATVVKRGPNAWLSY